MLKKIASFFTNLRHKLFVWRLEREIYGRIAPQIHREHEHGYPFHSDKELWKAAYQGNLDVQFDVETIEKEADKMGKAYGDAFRYLMYRDLNQSLARYKQVIAQRERAETIVARAATQHV